MKKRYVLTFLIPLILAAVIAFMMTPDPQKSFMAKLTAFEKKDNIYYDVNIVFSEQGRSTSQKIEQYKFAGNYYARYFQGNNRPIYVNIIGSEAKFGTSKISSSISVEQLNKEHIVFMLDKLSASNIKQSSIKRDKNADNDKYFAQLNDGTNIEVTFTSGMLSRIEYKNIEYSPYILNIETQTGDVVIDITGLRDVKEVDRKYILPAKTMNIRYEGLKSAILSNDFEYNGAEEIFAEFKRLFNVKDSGYQEEDYTEDDYAEEDYAEDDYTEDDFSDEDVTEDYHINENNQPEVFSNIEENDEPQIDIEDINIHEDDSEQEIPPEFEE